MLGCAWSVQISIIITKKQYDGKIWGGTNGIDTNFLLLKKKKQIGVYNERHERMGLL